MPIRSPDGWILDRLRQTGQGVQPNRVNPVRNLMNQRKAAPRFHPLEGGQFQ